MLDQIHAFRKTGTIKKIYLERIIIVSPAMYKSSMIFKSGLVPAGALSNSFQT
jgi:hypothetical protein